MGISIAPGDDEIILPMPGSNMYTRTATREDARGGAVGAHAPPKFQNLLNRPFKIQVERYMVLQNLPL